MLWILSCLASCSAFRTDHQKRVERLDQVPEEKKLEHFESYRRKQPHDFGVAIAYSRFLERRGEDDRAKAIVASMHAQSAHPALAIRLAELEPDKAEAHLRDALRLDATHPKAMVQLAHLLMQENRLDDCRAILEPHEASTRTDASALFALAQMYARCGDRPKAQRCWQQARFLLWQPEQSQPWWMEHFEIDLYRGHPRWETLAEQRRAGFPIPSGIDPSTVLPELPPGGHVAELLKPSWAVPVVGLMFAFDKIEPFRVVGIFPGSSAELAGLQIGDIVRAIDGQPFASAVDYLKWVDRELHGSDVGFEFERSGHTYRVAARSVFEEEADAAFAAQLLAAEAARERGSIEQALAMLERLRACLGDSCNRRLERAYITTLCAGNRLEAAIQVIDGRLAGCPRDSHWHNMRMQVCVALRERRSDDEWGTRARASYTEFAQIDPENARNWAFYAHHVERTLRKQSVTKGDLEHLEDLFDRALLLGRSEELMAFASTLDRLHGEGIKNENQLVMSMLVGGIVKGIGSSTERGHTSYSGPTGPGFTQPDPAADMVFSNLQSATYGW